MSNSANRLSYIAILQTLGIIFVLLGHVIAPYVWQDWWLIHLPQDQKIKMLYKWIYSFHMPLFFFIAGYLFNYRKHYEKTILQYLKERFKRLIIPFLAFSAMIWLPLIYLYIVKDVSFIIKFLTLKNCGHLWFLPALFVSLFIYSLLIKTPLKNHLLILAGLIFWIKLNIPPLPIPDIIYKKPLKYLFYIHIGYMYAAYFEREHKDTLNKLKRLCLLFVGIWIIKKVADDIQFYYKPELYPIYIITVCYVVAQIIANLCSKLADNRCIKYISKNVFGIYLVHYPLLIIIRHQVTDISPNESIYILLPILLALSCLLVSTYNQIKSRILSLKNT